ncbi:Uncharacterized protein HZ326_29767 [Fusarium oxysporum f. sp. albedinis]|nr:Uncharacterized protein HZ326_29767 [Fusarium oxysporum f. sp. albedinis]
MTNNLPQLRAIEGSRIHTTNPTLGVLPFLSHSNDIYQSYFPLDLQMLIARGSSARNAGAAASGVGAGGDTLQVVVCAVVCVVITAIVSDIIETPDRDAGDAERVIERVVVCVIVCVVVDESLGACTVFVVVKALIGASTR